MQAEHFDVAGDAGLAEELGADLHHFARLGAARGHRAQHAAGVAEPRDAGLVQEVRVDARDLRRDVRAHAEQPARQRVDDLERLQLEVAPGAREQRIEMLDERRLHEPVAARAEVIEQRRGAAPSVRSASAGRTSSMYSGRTHLRMAREPESGKPQQYRRQPDEAELPVGERHELGEALAPEARRDERQEALDDQHQRKGRPQRIRHRVPLCHAQRRQDYFVAFAPGPPWFLR